MRVNLCSYSFSKLIMLIYFLDLINEINNVQSRGKLIVSPGGGGHLGCVAGLGGQDCT